MRRLVAVAAAVAMVALAFVVRSRLDDDSDDGNLSDDGDGELTLLCDPDLVDACEASGLSFTEEVSGDTAARLREGGELDADVWITSAVWLDVVASAASLDAFVMVDAPIVVANLEGEDDPLGAVCPTRGELSCVVGAADELDVAIGDPDSSIGLAVAGQVTTALAGDGWALADLSDPDVASGLADLDYTDDPFRSLVVERGSYDAVIVDTPSTNDSAMLTLLEPEARIDVVAAGSQVDDGTLDPLREALVEAGWELDDPEVPESPYVDGAMAALWQEVSR